MAIDPWQTRKDLVTAIEAAIAAGGGGGSSNTILNGSGAPTGGTGNDGDFYIDTTANAIYGPKTSGSWGSSTSLVGPAGADGSDGANGTDGSDGADGDGFTGGSYDAGTGIVTFTSDDGLGFSTGDLRGADGADGSDGAQGPQGPAGNDGADGADGADAPTASVFYALGSGSANLGTSLANVPLATAGISDTGFSVASNEVTIGSELNGKRVKISWAVAGSGATNRVEIRSELQINSTRVKGSSNYTARNGTQNQGGVYGEHYTTVSTGDVIRIQALRDGSTANLIADETHLLIETKN